MLGKPDPLIAALDAAQAPQPTLTEWLEPRPDVSEAILRAVDRGVTYPALAKILSGMGYVTTSDTLRKWAVRQVAR